ncbi:MAG: hypothetical protein ACW99A_13375 [Candidatus Kariarchaeaceae archaeon]|jgi:hypothetical protein
MEIVLDDVLGVFRYLNHPVGLYLVALAGMFAHFLKKKGRNETDINISQFITNNMGSSINAWIWTTLFYIIYLQKIYHTGGEPDFMAVFMIGFAVDSATNKYSNSGNNLGINTDELADKMVSVLDKKIKES